MLIDQILYPVETLGPGKRVAIWVVGCTRGCVGCSNPELWGKEDRKSVSPIELFSAIKQISVDNPVDGFTITGGEPMDQAKELLELVKLLRLISSDILVFSGYTHQELLKNTTQREILNEIAVLVDGPYIEPLNNALPLRGSSNQNILYLISRTSLVMQTTLILKRREFKISILMIRLSQLVSTM